MKIGPLTQDILKSEPLLEHKYVAFTGLTRVFTSWLVEPYI